jgi:tRNA dimethylallyltransferase
MRTFFIVGPTAAGKSELAVDVARKVGAEIISADAFQIYRGLDLLTAKPDPSILTKAPHHLIGTIPLSEEMNAEKFRRHATRAIEGIHSRGNIAIVVGGSGLYIKTLTHGLAPLPESDQKLREKLNAMNLDRLVSQLAQMDPETMQKIGIKNRRRVVRALEVCLTTGKPMSQALATRSAEPERVDLRCPGEVGSRSARAGTATESTVRGSGVFVFRDREDLYQRINERVQSMFQSGVIDEVRAAGITSVTASQMIGLREIRDLIAAEKSPAQCIAEIQQATRRYAKRQLTWFRRQTTFAPLNLSFLSHNEAVKWIALRMLSEAGTRDD